MMSLQVLQESYDVSNRLYSEYRRELERTRWVEAADILTGNPYHKLKALEQERRKHFSQYYTDRKISCYPVEAMHVGEAGGTVFTEYELRRLAKSLSFVPLNINHANDPKLAHLPERRAIPYPSNQTLIMRYDPILEGVFGLVQVEDWRANDMIRACKINAVSIEYLSLGKKDGEGIVGTGLALVTSDVKPADRRARIFL